MALQFKSGPTVLAFVAFVWTSFCLGQTPQQTPELGPEQHSPEHQIPEQQGIASTGEQPSGQQLPDQRLPGNISGTIIDQSGAVVAGARVKLTGTGEDQSLNQEALSGDNGQFSFANIAPGSFQLTIASAGFATQTISGILHSGETCIVPQITLAVATDITEVQVGLPQIEVAEEQLKVEEKQRVLGVLPNFYISYVSNAVPLTSKQKFRLAWKMTTDPITVVVNGVFAGIEQAQNDFSGYGQGAEGYAKRFGAGYADLVSGTFIGSAILPSLLKQDPRYFYKGSGSKRSRILYALANSAICKGDNGRWQPNYSNVLGTLAAGGISNLYYPASSRNGARLTFDNAAIGIGATAVVNLLQEFFIHKVTSKVPNDAPAKP